jgi:hypothetical protein
MKIFQPLFFILLFFSPTTFAQTKQETNYATVFFRHMKTAYLTLPDSSIANYNNLSTFSSINFLDARFDSINIGYVKSNRNERLALKNGLCNSLQELFNKNTSKQNNGSSLLFIIHQFRLIESDTTFDKDANKLFRTNKLIAKFDLFVETKNNYQAAFRYDTTLYDFENFSNNKLPIITTFLNKLVAKVGRIDMQKVVTKNVYTLADIKESITDKFNLPIVKDSMVKKGVYVTYKEFINNTPSITEYKTDRIKMESVLLTKDEDGIWMPQKNIFGYSNGKKIWIKIFNNFFCSLQKR